MSGIFRKYKCTFGFFRLAFVVDHHYLKVSSKMDNLTDFILYNRNNGNRYLLTFKYSDTEKVKFQINLVKIDFYAGDETLHYIVHLHCFQKYYILKMGNPQLIVTNKTIDKRVLPDDILVGIYLYDSASKQKATFLSLLRCESCMRTLETNFYKNVCEKGHRLCTDCYCPQCPSCKRYTQQLQNFRSSSTQLCKQETCTYECPLKMSEINCKFVGDKDELIRHCFRKHSPHINHTREFCHFELSLSADTARNEILYAYGNIFKFHDTCLLLKIYASKEEAENYTFSVNIRDGKSKMLFSDVCKSINDKTDIENCKPLLNVISEKCIWEITITESKNTR